MDEFFKNSEPYVGTKGLVFIGDNILVYRRDNKTNIYPLSLDVPGGGAEPNETPFETYQREIKEEFGLIINKNQITYARRYDSVFKAGEFGWYAVATLPRTTEKQIIFGDEGVEYILMSLEDFLGRDDAWPVYQQRASDYAISIASNLFK